GRKLSPGTSCREGGVGREQTSLDRDLRQPGAEFPLDAFCSRQEDERAVGPLGQGEQESSLIALEAKGGRLAGRTMRAAVCDRLKPVLELVVQVRVACKLASVEEALAEVANWALDLALGLGAVGSARSWRKAPVGGKAQE